jgi:two-component system C4-dicarboxylate transport sensor histidine kinase DctB
MSFRAWLLHLRRHLSPDEGAASTREAFAPVTVLVVGIVALCTTWAPARAFTALRPWGVLGVMAFVLVLVAVSRQLPGRANWRAWQPQWFIVGNFFIGLIGAAFVSSSAMPGAAAFAGFFLLTTSFHGLAMRVSLETPWFVAVWVTQVALALVFNHDAAHITLWAILLPSSIVGGLVLGTSALQADRRQEEVTATRNALHAGLLAHEEREASLLGNKLRDYLGVQHDLKTPLFVAALEMEHVIAGLDEVARPDVREAATNVHDALKRLSSLMATAKAALDGRESSAQPVPLGPAIKRLRATIDRRFPGVELTTPTDVDAVIVMATGGDETLLRILENLTLNACEGDGTRGAKHVVLHVLHGDGTVVMHIDDDGPGFSEKAAGPVTPYVTTKSSGTGLGLFTVERLTTASGGELWRENLAKGGARVSVQLQGGVNLGPMRPLFEQPEPSTMDASEEESSPRRGPVSSTPSSSSKPRERAPLKGELETVG